MSISDETPAPGRAGCEQQVVHQRRLASVALTACGVTTVLVISRLDAWGGWNQIEVRGDGTPFVMAFLAASFCVLAVVMLVAVLVVSGRRTDIEVLPRSRRIRRLAWAALWLCAMSWLCLLRMERLLAVTEG